jgi:hypothetical protein
MQHKNAFKANKNQFILVTIWKISGFRAGPLKQNQRLASPPQADDAVKSLCKGGSWANKAYPTGSAKPPFISAWALHIAVSSVHALTGHIAEWVPIPPP